jgi:hypothetical protein
MSGVLSRLKLRVGQSYRRSALFRARHPRRSHVLGIGAPKTGTHSLAGLFEDSYRAEHEPAVPEAARLIPAYLNKKMGTEEFERRLAARDRRLWLEVDVAAHNIFFAETWVRVWPGARFILTVREPRSWAASYMDQLLNYRHTPHARMWQPLVDCLLVPMDYTRHDEVLRELGLPSLDAFLHLWTRHNRLALETIPGERLLVVRTREIGARVGEIETFSGAAAGSLNRERTHLYRAPKRNDVLGRLDPAYVEDRVAGVCGGLAAKLLGEAEKG